jgi:hypothetical protein
MVRNLEPSRFMRPLRLGGFSFSVFLLLSMAALCVSPTALGSDADPWVARDKALHFDASAGIASVTYAVGVAWLVDARWKGLALGGGVAIAAGSAKELLDAADRPALASLPSSAHAGAAVGF